MERNMKELVLDASLRSTSGNASTVWYDMFYTFVDTLPVEYNRPCGFYCN